MRTEARCEAKKKALKASLAELHRENSDLRFTAEQCRTVVPKLIAVDERLSTERKNLERKAALCGKERLKLVVTLARLRKEYAALNATLASRNRLEYVGLGKSCSVATTRCSRGLECKEGAKRICVPVCHDILAPDVVNARVKWERQGKSYRGDITCSPDAVYSGQDHPFIFCNRWTARKEWTVKMKGHCLLTRWYNFKALRGLEKAVPFTPAVGWSACLNATPIERKHAESRRFSIDLLDSNGSTLLSMKVTLSTEPQGKQLHWVSVLSSQLVDKNTVYRGHELNAAGESFPMKKNSQEFFLEIIASSESHFIVKVNGGVHAEYHLRDSLALVTTAVTRVRVKGQLFVSSLNLRCN